VARDNISTWHLSVAALERRDECAAAMRDAGIGVSVG